MASIGIIFDIDGVLVDSYAPHLRSWQLLGEEIGVPIAEGQFAATFGRTSREIIREFFGVTDPAAIRRLDDRKESLYRGLIREAVPAMPGAVETVARMYSAGFSLAVGSSGPPENVHLVCRELGLMRYLSAVVTGDDVQRGKPDPQVFELAAAKLALPPERCVVIEDAPAGIEAARRAGMRCVALTSTHPAAALGAAEEVITRLEELTSALILG